MVDEKEIVVRKPLPDPVELAREAWIIYRKRFWTFIGIGALAFLALILLCIILGVVGTVSFLALGAKVTPQVVGIGIILGLLFVVGVIVIVQWTTGTFIVVLRDWKGTTGIRENFKEARRFILPLVATSILIGIISLGSLFFFVIPAIIFSIWFNYWQYVVIIEKKSGLQALSISREYIRGRFWGVVWRMIAIHLPAFVVGIFFTRDFREAGPIHGVYQLISLLLVPFYGAYTYVLFTHLKTTSKDKQMQVVSQKSKLLYLLIPLAGYILLIITGIVAVPPLIKMVSSFSSGIPGSETQGTAGQQIKPSTSIVYGLTRYFLVNKKFPQNLQVLVDQKILTSIPDDTKTGLPYRYSVEKNGSDFKLCTPLTVRPEKCVSTASTSFDL